MRQVILASQSKQRQELLKALGFAFKILPADVDELAIDDIDHAVRAAKVATAKAEKIISREPGAIVIAADTFLVLDGERLEKPLSKNEAREMLRKMSARTVTVYTGWSYQDGDNGLKISDTSIDEITFRQLTDKEIQRYVKDFSVENWAGAFTLSHMEGIALVAKLNGSLTSVLGLPIEELLPYLRDAGVIT